MGGRFGAEYSGKVAGKSKHAGSCTKFRRKFFFYLFYNKVTHFKSLTNYYCANFYLIKKKK